MEWNESLYSSSSSSSQISMVWTMKIASAEAVSLTNVSLPEWLAPIHKRVKSISETELKCSHCRAFTRQLPQALANSLARNHILTNSLYFACEVCFIFSQHFQVWDATFGEPRRQNGDSYCWKTVQLYLFALKQREFCLSWESLQEKEIRSLDGVLSKIKLESRLSVAQNPDRVTL